MIKKSGPIFLPFCHKARVWQTDRQTDRRTDKQTDRILIAKPRLHSMQRGKNYSNKQVPLTNLQKVWTFAHYTAESIAQKIADVLKELWIGAGQMLTARQRMMSDTFCWIPRVVLEYSWQLLAPYGTSLCCDRLLLMAATRTVSCSGVALHAANWATASPDFHKSFSRICKYEFHGNKG